MQKQLLWWVAQLDEVSHTSERSTPSGTPSRVLSGEDRGMFDLCGSLWRISDTTCGMVWAMVNLTNKYKWQRTSIQISELKGFDGIESEWSLDHWELRRWLTKILLWRPFVPGSSHLTLTLATGSLQLERRSVFFVQCTGSEILWQKRKLMYLLIQVTPYALLIANTSCWFGTSRGNLVIGYCNHLILK